MPEYTQEQLMGLSNAEFLQVTEGLLGYSIVNDLLQEHDQAKLPVIKAFLEEQARRAGG